MKSINKQGFTIVEVMIVLAIAGLILAVVFIAVPALQRNQRNSARRNDIAYISSQFKTTLARNNNQVPSGEQMAGSIKGDELNYISVAFGSLNFSGAAWATQEICELAGMQANSPVDGRCNDGGTQRNRNAVCLVLGGSLSGHNCPTPFYQEAKQTTGTVVKIPLEDTGDQALIVTRGQCVHSVTPYNTIFGGVLLNKKTTTTANDHVKAPAFSQQSAIFYRLEGDDNLYCNNI